MSHDPDSETLPGDYAELFQQVYMELIHMKDIDYDFKNQNNTNIFESTKLEVLKLLLLVEDSESEALHKKYIMEKLERIINDIPIVLHPSLARRYEEEKREFS